ncbi:MAG: 30S ribosomal protein S1 [Rhodothermales bacterium]|nr:30S ribosomal protein S1 [Rhodothermales bacterium]
MAEEQQKTLDPQDAAEETVATEQLDDTPAVAQIGDETAAVLDTGTEPVHPDAPDASGDGAEVPTKEEGIPQAAEAAQTPAGEPKTAAEAGAAAAEPDSEDAPGLVAQAAEAAKQAAEAVADTVSEAAEAVAAAVTGSEDDAEAETEDDGEQKSILEAAVADAVSDMEVPEADASEMIIGGEREPITSIEGAGALTHAPQRGYTGEIVGRVVKLEDLEETLEEEESYAGYDQLKALIEQTLTDVSEHEIVKGRVVSVGEKDIVIDIGFKSDGVVPKNEFDRALEAGDEVEVYLERIEDYHGQLVLSKTKADKFRRWEKIENAFENEEVLEGTIIRRIKGGMIVDLLGAEAFLPGSQIDVRPVRDFDAYLEKRMEFKIVKINPSNENVVVSHKALIEKELEAQRDQILSTMEAGQILEGTVKNITDFGVFIDLGGVDGLLHITDLSWGRVSHPSELVDLDEKMKVVVLDYDKERQRISLGLKQLQPHPWETINEKFAQGQVVEGKVVSITDYGAFVELEKGIEGLVHISEMSWTDHIRHPSQKVSLGQLVNVKILNIDHEGKKISLGMKQLESNPWHGLSERYPPGTVLRGKVRNITNFGVFVEIEPGIDGLVHISDLSWTRKVKHPGEMVKKGQELDVVILDVDEDRQRVSLGHKQISTNPWADLANVYNEGTDTEVEVTAIEDKGLVVALNLDVEGFVPSSELRHGPQGFQSSYQVGQQLELRVIRFDQSSKEIILSETAKDYAAQRAERQAEQRERREERQREERAVRDFQQKSASGPTTLGELSGLEDLKRQMEAAEQAAEADAPAAEEAAPEEPTAEATAETEAKAETEAPAAEEPPAEATEETPAEDAAVDAPEAADADGLPTGDQGDEPVATLEAGESVEEVESFTKPTGDERAVTKEAVVEQATETEDAEAASDEEDAEAPTAEADAAEEADDDADEKA